MRRGEGGGRKATSDVFTSQIRPASSGHNKVCQVASFSEDAGSRCNGLTLLHHLFLFRLAQAVGTVAARGDGNQASGWCEVLRNILLSFGRVGLRSRCGGGTLWGHTKDEGAGRRRRGGGIRHSLTRFKTKQFVARLQVIWLIGHVREKWAHLPSI